MTCVHGKIVSLESCFSACCGDEIPTMEEKIKNSVLNRLTTLYGAETAAGVFPDLMSIVERRKRNIPERTIPQWSNKDAFLITYADSIMDGKAPLKVLRNFLNTEVGESFSSVHILPFYPYTSDDGFSITDFREVREDLGSWEDIKEIADDYDVVFDCVINHVSASSGYMRGYCDGNPAYADFFIAMDPETDTSSVTRPRTSPLLHPFETHEGKRWLWTTFSADQIDLNYSNPRVLLEMIDVLLFYAEKSAGIIRLDAIPFLWKQKGTTCSHLPQVHEIVKLFREVCDLAAPNMRFLTETNVPHEENIQYFGTDGNEAQMIYNFALPPLILYSMITGNASVLSNWASRVKRVGDHATYLNITATHDGIGLRPTEGILTDEEKQLLVDRTIEHGGS